MSEGIDYWKEALEGSDALNAAVEGIDNRDIKMVPGFGRIHAITVELPNNNTTADLEATFGPRLIKDRHNGTPGWVRLAFSPCPIIDTWAQVCLGTQDVHRNFSLASLGYQVLQ